MDQSIGSPSTATLGVTADGRVAPDPRSVLVERARAGDEAAFEVLIGELVEPALRTAFAILGDEADARDATQDAFLAVWRGLPGLRDPQRFDAWLRRIVVNSCRMIGRQRRRTAIREIHLDDVGASSEPVDDGRRHPEDPGPSLDDIERAFGRLSLDERSILVLHHLERHPVTEIAATLAIPVGTAKSRLFNARRSLERALEAELR